MNSSWRLKVRQGTFKRWLLFVRGSLTSSRCVISNCVWCFSIQQRKNKESVSGQEIEMKNNCLFWDFYCLCYFLFVENVKRGELASRNELWSSSNSFSDFSHERLRVYCARFSCEKKNCKLFLITELYRFGVTGLWFEL